jgi:hypothetical protein
MKDGLVHIVYLRSGTMLLTKKPYQDWRTIQEDFEDYMASLGPWSGPEVLDFLQFEYPKDLRMAEADRIKAFLASDETTVALFSSAPRTGS